MNTQKFIPKVDFVRAPLELEIKFLRDFSQPKNRWKAMMDQIYPDLTKALEAAKSEEEEIAACKDFADKEVEKNTEKILKGKEEIQKDWDQVSSGFLTELSAHFETEWPKDKNPILGYVTIVPVFPRFLDKYSFFVGYRKPAVAREIIAHEIIHFLWFKKWKEVFPEIARNEYESPHLVWRLSEIIDPIILQCEPKIKALIEPVRWGYDSFKNVKIGNVGMTEYFVKIYQDCVSDGKSFDEIMRILWLETQKNMEAIEKF